MLVQRSHRVQSSPGMQWVLWEALLVALHFSPLAPKLFPPRWAAAVATAPFSSCEPPQPMGPGRMAPCGGGWGVTAASSQAATAGGDSSAAAAAASAPPWDWERQGKLTPAADRAGGYLEDITGLEIILLTPFRVTYVRCQSSRSKPPGTNLSCFSL